MNNKKKIYLSLSSLGIEMGLSLAIFVFLGMWADKRWQIEPFGTLGGSLLGLIAAIRLAWQKIVKIKNWIEQENKDE
jgi:F0F1-type ATP synthase assembly protein I